eukprot:SM000034S12788  [mRNA]  locus=s34:744501:747331:- [translate_table: standard]
MAAPPPRPPPPTPPPPPLLLLVILLLLRPPPGLALEDDERPSHRSRLETDFAPADQPAPARGLVAQKLSYRSVLKEHGRYWANTTHRHFGGLVLAYVTPWNAKGYDVARTFRAKFTHVSPVWYQLKRETSGLRLYGGGDVDLKWMKSVRQKGHPIILPRVVLEGTGLDLFLKSSDDTTQAINLLVAECKEKGYDGLTLEAWSSLAAHSILDKPDLRQKALHFVRSLGLALHDTPSPAKGADRNMQLIFVIPPIGEGSHPSVFTSADVRSLAPDVDAFSLMTYDYSNAYKPGPNAPMPWVRSILQAVFPDRKPHPAMEKELQRLKEAEDEALRMQGRELKSLPEDPLASKDLSASDELGSKVLMGLNFFGNDFVLPQGGGPVVAEKYLQTLDRQRPKIVWEAEAQEHVSSYKKAGETHAIFFPTLLSISRRIDEARAWGVGLSIWEIGQGLDYFYDLL